MYAIIYFGRIIVVGASLWIVDEREKESGKSGSGTKGLNEDNH